MKFNFSKSLVQIVNRSGKVKPAVAVETFQALAEKERLAALGGLRDRVGIVAALIPVVGRIAGQNGSLKAGDGARQISDRKRVFI